MMQYEPDLKARHRQRKAYFALFRLPNRCRYVFLIHITYCPDGVVLVVSPNAYCSDYNIFRGSTLELYPQGYSNPSLLL
jgi:hypothetical protein